MSAESAGATHVGTVREVNEDRILASYPCFVVADGIGGAAAGDMASTLVVEEFALLGLERTFTGEDVRAALQRVNERIVRLQVLHGGRRSGATACGAIALDRMSPPRWALFNVGDTRIYRLPPGATELEQITIDHSRVQELLDAGAITPQEAQGHPQRNVVTRFVGMQDFRPDWWELPQVPGERLLLCSDGLLASLPVSELARVAMTSSPQQVVDELLRLALEAGAQDNVSIVVVDRPAAQTAQRSATTAAAPAGRTTKGEAGDDE